MNHVILRGIITTIILYLMKILSLSFSFYVIIENKVIVYGSRYQFISYGSIAIILFIFVVIVMNHIILYEIIAAII